MAMAMMMPENNDLIGWMRKINHAARAARTLVQKFLLVLLDVYQFNEWHLLAAIFYNQTMRKFNLTFC